MDARERTKTKLNDKQTHIYKGKRHISKVLVLKDFYFKANNPGIPQESVYLSLE